MKDASQWLREDIKASQDEDPIGRALAEAGFAAVETARENEWLAICAR